MKKERKGKVDNRLVFEAIKTGEAYSVIARQFKITGERVRQIAQANGYVDRREAIAQEEKKMYDGIIVDIENGLDITKMMVKYKCTRNKLDKVYKKFNSDSKSLSAKLREVRDAKVIAAYNSGKTARQIVEEMQDMYIGGIKRKHVNAVYYINEKHSSARYNNINNYTLETEETIQLICDLKDNCANGFEEIAEHLNSMGIRTQRGVIYSRENVEHKYKKAKAQKNPTE